MKNQVHLITYVQRLGQGTIEHLCQLLDGPLSGQFGGVHLLPFFYSIDGLDAGFDPIEHSKVDGSLGSWTDIRKLSAGIDIMADLIVNHISSQSQEFQDYQQQGESSPYHDLFLSYSSIFPSGAKETDLMSIYRPRPGLPFNTYTFADSSRKIMWTTFTPGQIDINVCSEAGKNYLWNILNTFSRWGISILRLDAVGYAVKKAGTSCFMIPETYAFIEELKQAAHRKKMAVLLEIHTHYQTQMDIAEHVDLVYDFCLSPLLLYTFITKDPHPLKRWLDMSPRNAITVLDTHDGIGIIDIGPSADKAGLLNTEQIDILVQHIHKNCRGESLESTGAAASNLDLYQINATYYSALACNDTHYLLARLMQFFAPGIPQVYYVGYFCGQNDMDRLHHTAKGREINRHHYTDTEITAAMQRRVQCSLRKIIAFRNRHPAFGRSAVDFNIMQKQDRPSAAGFFDGQFSIKVANGNTSVVMERLYRKHYASLTVNLQDDSFILLWSSRKGERMIRSFDELDALEYDAEADVPDGG